MWENLPRHLLLVGGQVCGLFLLVQLGRAERPPSWFRGVILVAALVAGIGACAGEFDRLEAFVMGMQVTGGAALAFLDPVPMSVAPLRGPWLWRGLALVLVIDLVPVVLFGVLGIRPFGVGWFIGLELVVVLLVVGATVRWFPPAFRGPPDQSSR